MLGCASFSITYCSCVNSHLTPSQPYSCPTLLPAWILYWVLGWLAGGRNQSDTPQIRGRQPRPAGRKNTKPTIFGSLLGLLHQGSYGRASLTADRDSPGGGRQLAHSSAAQRPAPWHRPQQRPGFPPFPEFTKTPNSQKNRVYVSFQSFTNTLVIWPFLATRGISSFKTRWFFFLFKALHFGCLLSVYS